MHCVSILLAIATRHRHRRLVRCMRVPCIYLSPFALDLVSATSFYGISTSHQCLTVTFPFPPLPLLYLMGSLLSHILTRTDSYLSFFVTRRLVFTRCISQARQQYRCTCSVVIFSLATLFEEPWHYLSLSLSAFLAGCRTLSRLRPFTALI